MQSKKIKFGFEYLICTDPHQIPSLIQEFVNAHPKLKSFTHSHSETPIPKQSSNIVQPGQPIEMVLRISILIKYHEYQDGEKVSKHPELTLHKGG